MSNIDLDDDLASLIRGELLSVPLEQWGYFFPLHVAVWRFLHQFQPALLGDIDAGYDEEPYFKGAGADWFVGTLLNSMAYLDAVERVMYAVADQIPAAAFARGFLQANEVPPLDDEAVEALRSIALKEIETAVRT